MRSFTQDCRVQFQTDQEHEQQHAHLGQDAEQRDDGRREQESGERRRHTAEQGRSQENACQHLPNDGRLVKVAEGGTEQPRDRDHADQGDQHPHQVVTVRSCGSVADRGHGRCGWGREILTERPDEEEQRHADDGHQAVGRPYLPTRRCRF